MPKPQLPPESHRKACTLCHKPRDVLVRCQIDPEIPIPAPTSSTSPHEADNPNPNPKPVEIKPNAWHFVCPGSCWQRVSGGVIDGDLAEGRRGYRYGGMWKNKHAGVSAKVPRRLKGKLGREGGGGEGGGENGGEKEDEEKDDVDGGGWHGEEKEEEEEEGDGKRGKNDMVES